MKKTLSINISGILFHIEEDGYDTLKNYLESINTHFSGYPDSKEIVSDIENRIAEIFLSYLKNNNQVITAENVTRLIEKMGTIADFSSLEEKEEAEEVVDPASDDFYKYVTPPNTADGGYKKLMRMEHKKILGGVCAGIAHYFAIDALWIRLIAILLLFSGNINLARLFDFNPFGRMDINFGFAGIAVVAYIVLWVILPVSYAKEENKEIKKLFRNPDDKALGGVASGLAAYFGIKVIYVRLAFVFLTFAGGSGIVIYLILWIITPLASSITERIKMKGGEITLDSIDSTLKETINPAPPTPESTVKNTVMVLMKPFQLLGQVIEALISALGSLGKFLLTLLRLFFGVVIFFFGMVLVGAPLVTFALYLGILDPMYYGTVDAFPLDMFTELVPLGLAAAGLGVLAIPGILILMLGLSVLSKKNLVGSKFALTVLALWLMCIATLGFQIPRVIAKFKEEERVITNTPITLGPGVLFLKVEDNDEEEFYEQAVLELKGTEDSVLTLNQEYFSRGQTKKQAQENIKKIAYSYAVKDSVITFERGFDLKTLGAFRDQKLNLSLAIPYNKPFIMDDSLLDILENTLYKNGYDREDVRTEAIWVFNESGLTCLTCPEKKGERRDWDSFESEKAQLDSITKIQQDSLSRAKLKDTYFLKEN
ncbi:MAG: PspC domain-containing protein [Algoriphagus sp.]|nr:PspC domain-containing protein [Algoriphagus sp.]